ncbi:MULTISPECIES: phosphotransferase [unclassified Marinovum]
MKLDDLPHAAWAVLRPGVPPVDAEALGRDVWRVGAEVLKLFPGADLARFRRVVRAHRQAGRIFQDRPGLAAQRLLGFDEPSRAVLLDYVPGQSGRAALLAGEAPERILGQSAQWLACLHAARGTARGRFDPWGPLERLPQVPVCAEPERYLAALASLRRVAEQLQGRGCLRAVLHGDMTLANLVFHDGTVSGIDFENLKQHPAARDIGELWADALLTLAPTSAEVGLMPPAWEAAFASAYPGSDVDITRFYTRHRLLRVWAGISAHPHDRGPSRDRQLGALRALIARDGFAI